MRNRNKDTYQGIIQRQNFIFDVCLSYLGYGSNGFSNVVSKALQSDNIYVSRKLSRTHNNIYSGLLNMGKNGFRYCKRKSVFQHNLKMTKINVTWFVFE